MGRTSKIAQVKGLEKLSGVLNYQMTQPRSELEKFVGVGQGTVLGAGVGLVGTNLYLNTPRSLAGVIKGRTSEVIDSVEKDPFWKDEKTKRRLFHDRDVDGLKSKFVKDKQDAGWYRPDKKFKAWNELNRNLTQAKKQLKVNLKSVEEGKRAVIAQRLKTIRSKKLPLVGAAIGAGIGFGGATMSNIFEDMNRSSRIESIRKELNRGGANLLNKLTIKSSSSKVSTTGAFGLFNVLTKRASTTNEELEIKKPSPLTVGVGGGLGALYGGMIGGVAQAAGTQAISGKAPKRLRDFLPGVIVGGGLGALAGVKALTTVGRLGDKRREEIEKEDYKAQFSDEEIDAVINEIDKKVKSGHITPEEATAIWRNYEDMMPIYESKQASTYRNNTWYDPRNLSEDGQMQAGVTAIAGAGGGYAAGTVIGRNVADYNAGNRFDTTVDAQRKALRTTFNRGKNLADAKKTRRIESNAFSKGRINRSHGKAISKADKIYRGQLNTLNSISSRARKPVMQAARTAGRIRGGKLGLALGATSAIAGGLAFANKKPKRPSILNPREWLKRDNRSFVDKIRERIKKAL